MRFIAVLLIFAYGSFLSTQSFAWGACLFLWNNIFQPMGFAYRHGALPVAQFVFVVLVFSYLLHLGRNTFKPRMNYMVGMSIIFLFWLALSSMFSPFQNIVWHEYFEIIKYIAPLMLISSALYRYRDILLISATLMLSVGMWSAQGGVKGLVSGVTPSMAIKYSQMSDNNDFVAAAVGILPMLLFFIYNYKGRYKPQVKLFLWAMFALTIAAIIFSNSRGAVVGVIGLIFFYILIASKKRLRDIVILSVVLLSVSIVLPDTFWERMSTIELSLEHQSEASASSRLHLMRSAFDCAMDNPIFGVGPNSWLYVAEHYAGTDSEPHSAYIKVAAETGFVGAGIFITLLIVTIRRLLVQRKRLILEENLDLSKLSLTLAMVLVGIAIPFTFLNHPYSEFLWAWLAVANAFLVMVSLQKERVDLFIER